MKLIEKQRLTALVRTAVDRISDDRSQIKTRALKAAAKYSPTNAEQYRALSEIVWWLIAAEANDEALELLDALCAVDDEYYWMFHALASSFATKAWLNAKQGRSEAAQSDACAALAWVHRDPNPQPITETEVRGRIERFDEFVVAGLEAKGITSALNYFAHALRILVMYQQFREAGDPACRLVAAEDYQARMTAAVRHLRTRLDAW